MPKGGWASKAQRRFMYARHPEIAKRWDREGIPAPTVERKGPSRGRTPKSTPGGIADRLSQAARNRAKLRSRRRSSRTRGR